MLKKADLEKTFNVMIQKGKEWKKYKNMWQELEYIYGLSKPILEIRKKYFPEIDDEFFKGIKETMEVILNEMDESGYLDRYRELENKLPRIIICELIRLDIIRTQMNITWDIFFKVWVRDFLRWAKKEEDEYDIKILAEIMGLYYSPECPKFIRPKRINTGTLIKMFPKSELKCELCGVTKALEIHHRIPISKGGTDDKSNLQILCKNCHYSLHHKN